MVPLFHHWALFFGLCFLMGTTLVTFNINPNPIGYSSLKESDDVIEKKIASMANSLRTNIKREHSLFTYLSPIHVLNYRERHLKGKLYDILITEHWHVTQLKIFEPKEKNRIEILDIHQYNGGSNPDKPNGGDKEMVSFMSKYQQQILKITCAVNDKCKKPPRALTYEVEDINGTNYLVQITYQARPFLLNIFEHGKTHELEKFSHDSYFPPENKLFEYEDIHTHSSRKTKKIVKKLEKNIRHEIDKVEHKGKNKNWKGEINEWREQNVTGINFIIRIQIGGKNKILEIFYHTLYEKIELKSFREDEETFQVLAKPHGKKHKFKKGEPEVKMADGKINYFVKKFEDDIFTFACGDDVLLPENCKISKSIKVLGYVKQEILSGKYFEFMIMTGQFPVSSVEQKVALIATVLKYGEPTIFELKSVKRGILINGDCQTISISSNYHQKTKKHGHGHGKSSKNKTQTSARRRK